MQPPNESGKKDLPGVIPPPVFYCGFFLLGWALHSVWPLPRLPDGLSRNGGRWLITLSFVLIVWVLICFYRAGTSFNFRRPSTALIRTGPFRFSRNPGYLSLTMLYVGLGLALNNLWVLLLALPAVLITHFAVILREEAYLRRRFPDEYGAYFDQVSRWL